MRTRIKICGITRLADAECACDAGVDALGFVFWSSSPRAIDVARARDLIRTLPPFVTPVGVFVNATADEVNGIVADAGLRVAQFHGDETADVWRRVRVPVIKSRGVHAGMPAGAFDTWPAGIVPLLDAADPERRGGTGRPIDWTVAAALSASRPIILAGGLRPDNVEDAIRIVRPWGVDVSSGVERSPGLKDADLIRAFVAAVGRGDARRE